MLRNHDGCLAIDDVQHIQPDKMRLRDGPPKPVPSSLAATLRPCVLRALCVQVAHPVNGLPVYHNRVQDSRTVTVHPIAPACRVEDISTNALRLRIFRQVTIDNRAAVCAPVWRALPITIRHWLDAQPLGQRV